MKKQLKKKNVYDNDDDDFDYSDYLPSNYFNTPPASRNIQQSQPQQEQEEKQKISSKPKYCFV